MVLLDDNSVPIRAYLDGKLIGEYENMHKAARSLFIRHAKYIFTYLNGSKNCTFKGKKTGIKSYKTGLRYHFEKA